MPVYFRGDGVGPAIEVLGNLWRANAHWWSKGFTNFLITRKEASFRSGCWQKNTRVIQEQDASMPCLLRQRSDFVFNLVLSCVSPQ